MSERREAPASRGFLGLDPRGWPGTIAVALVAAAVAIGLPALNRLVSADQALAAEEVLDVGRGTFLTVAAGWSLDDQEISDVRGKVAIHKGPLSLEVEAQASDRPLDDEYARLANEIRGRAGVQLFNDATTFTTEGGLTGIGGSYSGPETEGRFAVFRAGDTAVRLVAQGPPDAMASDLDDVEQMVQTLRIGPP